MSNSFASPDPTIIHHSSVPAPGNGGGTVSMGAARRYRILRSHALGGLG